MSAMIRYALVAPLLLAGTTAARAEDDWCRNGLFPEEPPFALARVTGKGRAWLLDDMDGCPDKGAACRSRNSLKPGALVVISRTHGGYTCAFLPNRSGGAAGWVDSARLEAVPVANAAPPTAWLGTWASGDNPVITFRDEGGALHVEGEAYWPGPRATRRYPTVHVGMIDGAVALTGNRGAYADDDLCEIAFTLLGPLLVAGDNGKCGGFNVSFSGVYARKRK